ncbi:cation transporter [Desulfovibrio sp. OttesenSCG-928-A18]|nr:cation transporter [Desulfovibrio sp. OttesenSCG-928-A18]
MPSINVQGMRCEHCRKSVSEAVSKVPGVTAVEVDLQSGKVSWTDSDPAAPAPLEAVKQAVTGIGFSAS